MILATMIIAAGLVCNIVVVQRYDLRLLGVVTVPIMAFYALYSFFTVPVILVAGVAAYVSLTLVDRHLFVYGYDRLLLAIVVGLSVPLLVAVFAPLADAGAFVDELYFLGSVFPGIAAYNLHAVDPDRRVDDLLASATVFTGLVALGVLLVHTDAVRVAERFPPVLLRKTSDLATSQGVALPTSRSSSVFGRLRLLAFVVFGMAASELVRRRWQLRLGGIVTLPLLAAFVLRDAGVLPAFVGCVAAAYGAVVVVNWSTLLYGRVVLALAVVVGLLVAVPLTLLAGVQSGILGVFGGSFAGVAAYNLHKLPPHARSDAVALSGAVFLALLGVGRLLGTPRPTGAPTDFQVGHLLLLVGVALVATLHLLGVEARTPARRTER